MNMQKILNVAILLFVIINLVLLGLIRYKEVKNYTLSDQRVSQLMAILRENNVTVDDFLPDYYPMTTLWIKQPENIEDDLVMLIFGNTDRQKSYTDSSYIHENDQVRLTFDRLNEPGRVFYGAFVPTYIPQVYDEVTQHQTAERFVKDITLDHGHFEETDIRGFEGGAQQAAFYFFNERFEDYLIFCNEVVVKLEKGRGITEARAIRYVPYSYGETNRYIKAIDEILYKNIFLIKQQVEGAIRLTDIDLGYYLSRDVSRDFVSTELEPYYRIKLGSGETFFINAYTNEMIE